MTFQPQTIEEAEAYAKFRNLAVNAADFIMHYEDSEPPWTKKPKKGQKVGDPVYNWKLTMQTWHRVQLERGGMPKCCYSGCKKPAPYIIGKDRDGHPYKYCLDHRPKPKPLPKELVPDMKKVESPNINFNNERNKQMGKLAKKVHGS